jgi:hypothetical protein
MDDMALLKTELETYEKHKQELLASKAGRFVLIKGDAVIDDFETYGDALKRGYELYKKESFLVKQVVEFETTNFITRDLTFTA